MTEISSVGKVFDADSKPANRLFLSSLVQKLSRVYGVKSIRSEKYTEWIYFYFFINLICIRSEEYTIWKVYDLKSIRSEEYTIWKVYGMNLILIFY